MGLFDGLHISDPIEEDFDSEYHELKVQRNKVLSQIGQKFVDENKGRSMIGTGYEDLFIELSEIEKEMDADLNFERESGGQRNVKRQEKAIPDISSLNYNKIIIIGLIILILVILGGGISFMTKSRRSRGDNNVSVAKITDATENEIIEGTEVTTEEGITLSGEEVMAEFGIYRSNVADYGDGQVTDYTRYQKYRSETGKFSFAYPSDIYNDVSVVSDKQGGTYGKIISQISMNASDGSTAVFTVFENWITSKSNSLESMTNYVVKTEKETVFTPIVRVNEITQDGSFGTVIITAYADGGSNSECVYDLCRIDRDNVYQMRLTYPRPKDEEDDKHKAYFTEAMYKMCGFSGSGENIPDSYDAFVSKNYTAFQLSDSQKAIFWNIMDNMVTSRGLYDSYEKESVVPVGSRNELARTLSGDLLVLQMYLQAGLGKDRDYIKSESLSSEKELLSGSLDYAKTFYRDLFGMELDVNRVFQDNQGITTGDMSLLLYNRDYDELVYCSGSLVKNTVDGPDDWDYNEEMDCFDYHMGPVYEMTAADSSWEQKRDAQDPGNGIYVAHLRPYYNNSLGFTLLGIERVE